LQTVPPSPGLRVRTNGNIYVDYPIDTQCEIDHTATEKMLFNQVDKIDAR
jgi:hypothetical protein